jgi:hypothetical protein
MSQALYNHLERGQANTRGANVRREVEELKREAHSLDLDGATMSLLAFHIVYFGNNYNIVPTSVYEAFTNAIETWRETNLNNAPLSRTIVQLEREV